MQLTPEDRVAARIANEILLNTFRTLKFSGFTPDTQKVIMRCVGVLVQHSTIDDQTIDETIQNVEDYLYRSQFPEFYEHIQL